MNIKPMMRGPQPPTHLLPARRLGESGSPLDRISYRPGVTMFTEELPWLTAEDKTWIMGRGLCEWLAWE